MRKTQIIFALVLGLVAGGAHLSAGGAVAQRGARARYGTICPDPAAPCRTGFEFESHQLRFTVPENAVISETELFYAVVLKSMRDVSKGTDCNIFVPESERLEAQGLFPHHKVFASRCLDVLELYYTNVAPGQQFMAVYAGRTRAEAEAMLGKVRATGKFPGANLRRMRAGFNGT